MKISFLSIIIFLFLIFLLNPIYQVRPVVQVVDKRGEFTGIPVIGVHGGVESYSLRTLGIKRKKVPVRGWLFSGTISEKKLSRIESVTLSTDALSCIDGFQKNHAFDFKVTTQNQVGKVLNFQIPVDFHIECEMTMTVFVNEEVSNKAHVVQYRIIPGVRHVIAREWAR